MKVIDQYSSVKGYGWQFRLCRDASLHKLTVCKQDLRSDDLSLRAKHSGAK